MAALLLAEVGLAERGSSPIATCCRGVRQRLGVARALVNVPNRVGHLDSTLVGIVTVEPVPTNRRRASDNEDYRAISEGRPIPIGGPGKRGAVLDGDV
jgi:hypothetical protein